MRPYVTSCGNARAHGIILSIRDPTILLAPPGRNCILEIRRTGHIVVRAVVVRSISPFRIPSERGEGGVCA